MTPSRSCIALTIWFGFAAASADVVVLTNGDLLTGHVVESTADHLLLHHAVLGAITIPADHVVSLEITPPDASPPAAQPPVPPAPDTTSDPLDADTATLAPPSDSRVMPFLHDWNTQLELGFNGSDGNSQVFNLRAAIKANQQDESHRWRFDASYYISNNDGERSADEATIGLLKDWLLPDAKWFYFAQGRFDYDEFQAWQRRASGAGGIGYQFIDNDTWNVLGRLGAGVTKELGEPADELRPEALLGGELTWQISPRQSLGARSTLYPDLGEFGDSRITSAAEWVLQLDRFDDLSLKFGIEHEYESITEDDSKHNDVKFFGALVIDF